ncbi:hypothetical protein HYX18_00360 [Candidatus Woesearchaeota archaeon]|nr:hypothetical protein [Candidatus Woesearchaeota archaeon]
MSKLNNKLIQGTNAVSGSVSVLGSYQICHNICMVLISLLSILGFTIIGMPLVFLTKIATPFWIAAVSLLTLMIILKLTIMKGLSTNMMILNSGLIIAGIPFKSLQIYKNYFFIMGGLIALLSIVIIINNKLHKERRIKNETKC